MTPPAGKTVFIVDDDADLRDALALLMRAAGLRAECFANARAFLQRCSPRDEGCLVLDIRMPGMSGMELQAELHKRRVSLPIVFLTGHGDVPLAVKAMKAGAADFIQKPLDEHRLVMAVLTAMKSESRAARAPENPPQAIEASGRLAALSRRELDVLQLMAEGRQSKDIADILCISLKTVEFHRANIREKLGVSSMTELLRLVLSGEPPPPRAD